MLLDVPCKQGRLQVAEEGIIRVMAPFNKTIWQVPCTNVTGFTTQPGAMTTFNVLIHTTQGIQQAEMVTRQNFDKLQALFPGLGLTTVQGREWYHDITKQAHVATYTNQRHMQHEVEAAAQYGWVLQGTAAQNGKFSMGKALAGGVLLGPVGLLAGAVGNKDKITITFVRAAGWQQKR